MQCEIVISTYLNCYCTVKGIGSLLGLWLHMVGLCPLRHRSRQLAVADLTGGPTLYEKENLELMCQGSTDVAADRRALLKDEGWVTHPRAGEILEKWIDEECSREHMVPHKNCQRTDSTVVIVKA